MKCLKPTCGNTSKFRIYSTVEATQDTYADGTVSSPTVDIQTLPVIYKVKCLECLLEKTPGEMGMNIIIKEQCLTDAEVSIVESKEGVDAECARVMAYLGTIRNKLVSDLEHFGIEWSADNMYKEQLVVADDAPVDNAGATLTYVHIVFGPKSESPYYDKE